MSRPEVKGHVHKRWIKARKYRKVYEAMEEKVVLAAAGMGVRNRAGLTQEQLAQKMGTTQPVVATHEQVAHYMRARAGE